MHHPPDDEPLSEDTIDDILLAVGAQIRRVREAQGISQRAAARDAGMHQTDWSRVERGVVDARLSTLLRVQHALDLAGFELLFGQLPSRVQLPPRGDVAGFK